MRLKFLLKHDQWSIDMIVFIYNCRLIVAEETPAISTTINEIEEELLS